MIKMEKKDLKFLIIFILVITIAFTYLFQSTYAKYRRGVKSHIEASIAGWIIKINNEDIANKTELTNTIIPNFEGTEYVKENVIAPGSIGYCDITIQSTDVDVKFKTTLTANPSEESTITDLQIIGFIVNPESTDTTINSSNYTAYNQTNGVQTTINKNTPETKIRIFIKWDDSETNNMSNADDTNAALSSDATALLEFYAKFEQVNG